MVGLVVTHLEFYDNKSGFACVSIARYLLYLQQVILISFLDFFNFVHIIGMG